MDSTTAPLAVDLKLTYENIQRRFSCSPKRPTWRTLSAQIKNIFGLHEDFNLGLSYIDEDGESVVLSSDVELGHVWPTITDDDEEGLDSIPPLRFNIVQLPSSHLAVAGTAGNCDSATPSGDSVNTMVSNESEDDDDDIIVDEVASGISDLEIVDADHGDGKDDDEGDKKDKNKHKKERDPKKKKKNTTLQEDITAFIDIVKGTVEGNEEIHKAFSKIILRIHRKHPKEGDEDEGQQDEEGDIIALAIFAEETGKMDAVTAGMVSAMLAPALMGPPRHPLPHPPHGPHHPLYHRPGFPLPPPHHHRHWQHRGPDRDDLPPPPSPPLNFAPHSFGFEREDPTGRPRFHHAPPPFLHRPDLGNNLKHGHAGDGRRGWPYGMPPHASRQAPFARVRYEDYHHGPFTMFVPRGHFDRHDARTPNGPLFGPHRHHGRHAHAHFLDGHGQHPPFLKHHTKNRREWAEGGGDFPGRFGNTRMGDGVMGGELESDNEIVSVTSSSSEEMEMPDFRHGRHGRCKHGRFGPAGGPDPAGSGERRPRGHKHHRGHRGPRGHGRHGRPKAGDMPAPFPPPPPPQQRDEGHSRHRAGGPSHYRRWA